MDKGFSHIFDRRPTFVRQQIQGHTNTDSQQNGKIEEGNEEVRLIYSTAPEKSVENENTTETSNVQQTVNKKLAPILLLASYL